VLEKLVALFVIICVVFILFCNYVVQEPVQLKSSEFSDINIKAGTLRLPQDDPRILYHISNLFLKYRPRYRKREDLETLSEVYRNTETRKITDYILKLTKNQTRGFFIEYPAKDGVQNTQTILLEKMYNWTGLLVEHDPKYMQALKEQGRYCWISTACLSSKQFPELAKHDRRLTTNTTGDSLKLDNKHQSTFLAQCFPLYSILLSFNVNSIDFLSLRLDDPDAALAILKTLPFNWSIFIKIISIDVADNNKAYARLFQYVTSEGYIMTKYMKGTLDNKINRQIYVHKYHFRV